MIVGEYALDFHAFKKERNFQTETCPFANKALALMAEALEIIYII